MHTLLVQFGIPPKLTFWNRSGIASMTSVPWTAYIRDGGLPSDADMPLGHCIYTIVLGVPGRPGRPGSS